MTFTTHKKSPKKQHLERSKTLLFSIDETLMLSRLYEGEMVHTGFDCPLNLRTAFNRETKANGSSTCQELRHFMAAYVTTSMLQNLTFTTPKISKRNSSVSIGALNFTQNVQSRPRRLVSRNNLGAVVNDDRCMVGQCKNNSVDTALYHGKEYRLCKLHAANYAGAKGWVFC